MTMPPGSGEDLDEQVASAIADNDFRRIAGEEERRYEYNGSLLSVVASHGRLDLVNDLIAAGASVEKDDVFANMSSEAVRSFLMAHCPLDATDYSLVRDSTLNKVTGPCSVTVCAMVQSRVAQLR